MRKRMTAMLLAVGLLLGAGATGELHAAEVNSTESVRKEEEVRSTLSYGTGLTHDAKYDKYEKVYGVDVSKWQGTVDWNKVKNAGIEYAILRIGYRASATGKIYVDPYFEANMKGAKNAGIHLGVYFYTQAISKEEAKEEAQFVLDQLKAYPGYLSYPVYFDIENESKDRMGKAKVSTSLRTAMTKTFCETIKKGGYEPGIYTNYLYFLNCLYLDELDGYELWLARYHHSPTYNGQFFPKEYSMWQYSDCGKVDGISGNADMNVYYRKLAPEKPSGLKQTESSDSEIALSWNRAAFAEGYEIVCMDQDGKQLMSVKTSDTTYRLTKLSKGECRKIKIRAYNVEREGGCRYSKYSSVLTVYTLPEKVEGIEQTEGNLTSVTIQWQKVEGAAGYRIRIYDPKKKTYQIYGTTIANTYKIADLNLGEEKKVIVDAYVIVNGKTKKYAKASEPCVIEAGLKKVRDVEAITVKSDTVTLVWKAQDGVSGYEVNCYDEDEILLSTDEVQKARFTRKSLEPSTLYMYEVCSYIELTDGSRVYGDYSEMYCIPTLPKKVVGMKAIVSEEESVTFAWDAQENVSGYRVYLYDSKTKKSKLIKKTSKNSYTMKELKPSTTYYVTVKAYYQWNDMIYCGAKSSLLKIKTK